MILLNGKQTGKPINQTHTIQQIQYQGRIEKDLYPVPSSEEYLYDTLGDQSNLVSAC